MLCFKASVPSSAGRNEHSPLHTAGDKGLLHWFQGAETPAQLASPAFLYLLTTFLPRRRSWLSDSWVWEKQRYMLSFVFFFDMGSACKQEGADSSQLSLYAWVRGRQPIKKQACGCSRAAGVSDKVAHAPMWLECCSQPNNSSPEPLYKLSTYRQHFRKE